MCETCTQDPKMRRDAHESRARQLERMADYERRIGSGEIKPHTEQVKPVAEAARRILRYLAEDWL